MSSNNLPLNIQELIDYAEHQQDLANCDRREAYAEAIDALKAEIEANRKAGRSSDLQLREYALLCELEDQLVKY